MSSAYEELSLNHLLKSCVRKYKYFIASFLVAALLVGGYFVLGALIKPAYLANSVVLIYPKGTSSDTDAYLEDGKLNPKDLGTLKEAASSYINLINNRWVINKALDNLSIKLDDTEQFMIDNVAITNIGQSPYLNIEIKFSNAETAYRINQEIINIMPGMLKDLNIGANFTVISYPVMPGSPDLPGGTTLAAIGVGLGLLLGFLFVLLSELFYSTFRSDKDIKRVLDIESIGYLPTADSNSKRQQQLFGNALKNAGASLVLSGSRVFAIVDGEPNEQYGFATYGLAQQLAILGYNILFIDFADAKSRNVPRFPLQLRDHKNIQYINICENNELLKPGGVSNYIRALLSEENDPHSFVLLSMPPVSSMFFGVECYDLADQAILMLRHDHTKQDEAKRLLGLLKKSSLQKYSCILYDINNSGVFNYYSEFAQ
ncbi:MAG: YveK family protein [Christensenellales bacterium]